MVTVLHVYMYSIESYMLTVHNLNMVFTLVLYSRAYSGTDTWHAINIHQNRPASHLLVLRFVICNAYSIMQYDYTYKYNNQVEYK